MTPPSSTPARTLCKALGLAASLWLLGVQPASHPAARADEGGYALAEPAIREVVLTGFTRAIAHRPLVAESEGRVESVAYDVGERIGEDAIFARLDETFTRLELEDILVQQDRLRSQIRFDEREVGRYATLARENNAAATQLDTAEQTLQNDRHALRALAVQQRVLEERLRRKQIMGQTGWRVTSRGVEPGQWVRAGEQVGELADFRTLIVPFALTPEQYAALSLAARGTDGIVLTLPDQEIRVKASVYRVNPGFDPVTRKIALDLRLDGPIEPRRGGLRARLSIPMPERGGAVRLPAAAVRHSYEEYWVEPVDGEPVRVLLLGRDQDPDGTQWLRVSGPGIQAGDRVRVEHDGVSE